MIDYTKPVPIPSPPPPDPKPVEKTQQSQSVITAPETPFDFDRPPADPSTPLPPTPPLPPGPIAGTGNGLGTGTGTPATPTPSPSPRLLDPIMAKPRGNPGSWITTSDYRSIWIRREMVGTAGFSLQISATGRVTGCTITASTGHAALDEATCSLIQKRARFDPARDNRGDAVAGTYRNSVTWRLPE
jgi:protein TonB